jgi:hypothetical protein
MSLKKAAMLYPHFSVINNSDRVGPFLSISGVDVNLSRQRKSSG